MLCFVNDPEAVVAGVARALKPGGVFAIQDYMHYEGIVLAPESEPFRRFIRVVAGGVEGSRWRHGNRTAPTHAPREARPDTSSRSLPCTAWRARASQLWTWPTIFVETYGPKLVEEGKMTREEYDALGRGLDATLERSGRVLLLAAHGGHHCCEAVRGDGQRLRDNGRSLPVPLEKSTQRSSGMRDPWTRARPD